MSSKAPKVPPPPQFTQEERDLLTSQKLTLDQFRDLLAEESVGKKETQDLLKNISGLYKDVMIKPEETVAGGFDYKADPGAMGGALGKILGHKNEQMKKNFTGRGAPPTATLWNMTAADVRNAVNKGVVTKEQGDAFLEIGEKRAATGGNFGRAMVETTDILKGDPVKAWGADWLADHGFGTKTKLDDKVNKAVYETQLDKDAVAALRSRVMETMDYDERLRADAQKALDDALQEQLKKTPLDEKQESIANLQAERLEKALKGELPVTEATTQAKAQEFQQMKDALSAAGHEIVGDSLESASGKSTPAVQALDSLKKRYKIIEEAERRGEIETGFSNNINQGSYLQGEDQRLFSNAYTLRNMANRPAPGQLAYLDGAMAAGPGGLLPMYAQQAQMYGAAAQPYSNQRMLGYQGQIQNVSNKYGLINSLFSLGGSGMMAAAMMSSKDFKKNIEPMSPKEDSAALKKLASSKSYRWDYKHEPDAPRRHHRGVLAEEAPDEILTDDRKHIDIASYLDLLSSSVRALDRKISRRAA